MSVGRAVANSIRHGSHLCRPFFICERVARGTCSSLLQLMPVQAQSRPSVADVEGAHKTSACSLVTGSRRPSLTVTHYEHLD